MFREVFQILKKREWESSVLKQFLQLISDQLLLSSCAAPAGLLLHVLDLYMTELALVGAAELTADQNLVFIEPFCRTMARTKDRQLLQAIGKSLLSTIVDQVPFAIEDLLREIKQSEGVEDEEQETVEPLEKSASEDEEERDGAEDGEEHQAVLQFDYGALADRLFNAASHSYIHSFNRSKIYKFVKIFRDLAEGVFPQDEVEDVSTDEDDCDDPSRKRNTKKLAKRKDSEKREPSSDADTKPKKKRKKNEEKETQRGASEEERLSPELSIDDDVVEAEACPEASVEDSPVTPSQKKKKRRKKKKRKAAEAKPLDENKRKPNERNGDDPLPTETNEKREADKPETKGEDSPQWSEEIPESQKNEDPSKLNHSPDPTENNKGKGSPESLEAEDVIEAEGVSVEDSPVTPSQKKNAVETQFSEEKKSQANCDEAEEKPELKREDEDSEADANRLRLKKTNAEVQSQTEAPSEITSENPDVLRGDDQSHPMPNGDGTTEGAVMEKDLASDRNPETRAAGHIVILRAKRRKQKGARLNRSEERTKKVRMVKDSSVPLNADQMMKKVILAQKRAPKPLFCRATGAISKKVCPGSRSEGKKVTFGLKNNRTMGTTALSDQSMRDLVLGTRTSSKFRRNDRSSALSPEARTRLPFDPRRTPSSGVLKRARAQDFF
ncbi:hypothetical protein DNTS_003338 [Danionella cerebrum]|nr:hypothetical protein DNTS_003338 [Danionella translucida]